MLITTLFVNKMSFFFYFNFKFAGIIQNVMQIIFLEKKIKEKTDLCKRLPKKQRPKNILCSVAKKNIDLIHLEEN